jgi:hypothetical protein
VLAALGRGADRVLVQPPAVPQSPTHNPIS